MITYDFTDIGSDSLYEYLYKCIRHDIMNGTIKANDKLPSKRSFAKHLGVSNITVENAYAQLVAEGYLYTLPKKGFYVSELSLTQPIHTHGTTTKCLVPSSRTESVKDTTTFLYDFKNNQTQANNFPFSIWTKLMREVISTQKDALMTPPPGTGIDSLREGIANHLKSFRGIEILPEQIIIGAGTEYLYGLLIQLFGVNHLYAVEDPGYQKISQIYKSHNVSCCHIPMDENGIDIPALFQSNANIVHISPTHHFPTGINMPISRRYELLSWASSTDMHYIIEDDYDSEFRLHGKPIPSLLSIDVMDKVVYMNTFTKSLSSTIRISYMVLPMSLLKRFKEQLSFYSCTVSNFEQYTLAKFIKEGYFEKHINRMRNFYRNQRDLFMKCISSSPYYDKITITEANSGLHFLLHANVNRTGTEIVKTAERKGLRISSIAEYFYEAPSDDLPIFIINYSCLNTETMKDAVTLLCNCIFQKD